MPLLSLAEANEISEKDRLAKFKQVSRHLHL
jgi:hypothetical protein